MKILFVVKTIDFIDPIGMMLLSAIARKNGHQTKLAIIDREDVLATIENEHPDAVAYSAHTGEHKYYLELNARIKARFPSIVTMMGGPHPTFYPEVVTESTLDAVCVGEGDEAFPEFLDAVAAGKDFSGIANIATKSRPRADVRHLFEDLDSLPYPDRELYYSNTEMAQFPLKSFMASRGCPYPCTYCFNHAFRKMYHGKGHIIRRHSVDYMIDQVLDVKKKYPLECVKFYDDIFIYHVDEWIHEFAEKYRRKIGLPFHCLTRANLVTEDIVKILKDAGCHSVSMSIESGNDDLRNNILKRAMTKEQIINAFELFHKYGIYTFSNNILGLPTSTIEKDIETLDLNLRCKVTFAEFPIFHPYPRTELGDYCVKEGLFDQHYENLHMSYQSKSPLSCFSEEEKNMQLNLSELGLIAVWFPWTRNFIVNHLIKLQHSKLFFLAYFFAKAWLVNRKIYPFKVKFGDGLRLFRKSLRLEKFKHKAGD